jgi:hypothetical protein
MKTNITFLNISRSVLLRMRNVPDKRFRENQNTHYIYSNSFSKIVPCMRQCGKYCRSGQSQMKIWRMRIACWTPKTTNTHSECVISIVFPRQQWLEERTSMLRYTYISRIVHLGTGRRWVVPSDHDCFIPGEKALGTHWSGGRVDSMNFGEDNPSPHKVTTGRI